MKLAWMRIALVVGCLALALLTPLAKASATKASATHGTNQVIGHWNMLDSFENVREWTALASDDVKASLRQSDGIHGKSLCLAYDFNGVSGYAVARRELPMVFPKNFEYSIAVRGTGAANNLEFKLVDASGDNVWWATRPNHVPPLAWTELRLKKRHFSFAWGPTADRQLRRTQAFEITIAAGKGGGRGELCLDALRFRQLAIASAKPPRPIASSPGTSDPANTVDGNFASRWSAPPGKQSLTLDLGAMRELGGITLHWGKDEHATHYEVLVSEDGCDWRRVREVRDGNGGTDPIALPEAEARWLRLDLHRGPGVRYTLAEVAVENLEFAATPNDFIRSIAATAQRGQFPRGFSGEQPYWTLLGIDGGTAHGLIGEDGAIEVAKGGFSIEPFLILEGQMITWADVEARQSLADGYLPIPSVDWLHPQAALKITAFAQGTPDRSQMVATYRLENPGSAARGFTLALAVRPLQVNPPSQFLNTVGGVSQISELAISARGVVSVEGKPRVFATQSPDHAFVTSFEAGMVQEHLASGSLPNSVSASDETALASGAMLYRFNLAPGESRSVSLRIPLTGTLSESDGATAEAEREAVADIWRKKLGRVGLRVPAQGQRVVDTLRTALAHMLISRQGPRLQPGTRSYARAWIRDGAMISESLLRLGHEDVASEFLEWYAPHQFANGKVPCCVDDRGSDPVPENDSHGQLIFSVAELHRFTGDTVRLSRLWPRVLAAARYMDGQRLSERTAANRERNPAFYGLMPASISHEGYSAKPMHSYWDDFWTLRGYKDAVAIAQWLGHDKDAAWLTLARDQFRADLTASLLIATARHDIDFLPGAAELGDFDATSTTIALAPGGEQSRLPSALLRNTFERYWQELSARHAGTRAWEHYTPYELRNVGVFVRLGWRDRAQQALHWFFADRQPSGWNQWAEVVAREPRKPFFLGDLPHAWVASDYVRSALDLFAYAREDDAALVIAAGIPQDWLAGEGVQVSDLRTPFGELSYVLRRDKERVLLTVKGVSAPGGVVLPWPGRGASGTARINGKPAKWVNGELRIRQLPADIEIQMPHQSSVVVP